MSRPKVGEREAMEHPGYLVDVPVTLTVAVRGPGLITNTAYRAAREFAEGLFPTQDVLLNYALPGRPLVAITEATLEMPSDESASILDRLEPEGDE